MCLIGNSINPNYMPRKAYQAWMNKARDEHNEGQYNAAIKSARTARDIALYEIERSINHYLFRDAHAFVQLNYRTMREMGIN